MIAYRTLRALGRLALRWFYREVEVVGLEHLPDAGPVLLASNHPNALVDALVVGCTLRRPVTLTAKATLLENPVTRALLRVAGVVPLRRANDALRSAGGADGGLDPARNADAFAAVLDVLEAGGMVLIFPEGKRTMTGEIGLFMPGVGMIGSRLSVPVVPVRLDGKEKSQRSSARSVENGARTDCYDGAGRAKASASSHYSGRVDLRAQVGTAFARADAPRSAHCR